MKKRILIYGSLGGLFLLLFIGYMLLQSPATDVAAQTSPTVQDTGPKAKQEGSGAKAKQEKTPAKEEGKEQRPKDESGFDKAAYGMSADAHDELQKRFKDGIAKDRARH